MNSYRLDQFDSKVHTDQFDETKLELLLYRAEGLYRQSNGEWERVAKASSYSDTFFIGERPSQRSIELKAMDFTFGVDFPDDDYRYSQSWYLEQANSVLSQIGELDAKARTQVSTSWEVNFKLDSLGHWSLAG